MALNRNHWIGFDNLFRELEVASRGNEAQTYPPHNIVALDNDHILIELATAGFSENDLDIEYKGNLLTIQGEIKDAKTKTYVWKGIAHRKFIKAFRLGDHFKPMLCVYKDGVLSINLERNIPEEERPKKLKIESSNKTGFIQD